MNTVRQLTPQHVFDPDMTVSYEFGSLIFDVSLLLYSLTLDNLNQIDLPLSDMPSKAKAIFDSQIPKWVADFAEEIDWDETPWQLEHQQYFLERALTKWQSKDLRYAYFALMEAIFDQIKNQIFAQIKLENDGTLKDEATRDKIINLGIHRIIRQL